MKQFFFLAGLSAVLCGLTGSLAGAAEPYAGSAGPAVDGFNAKVDGFGGATGGRALYGGGGSVAVPLGFRYGLQIDALVGGADNHSHGDLSSFGTGAHLFWRDPARGLFGAYGRYLHLDAVGGVNSYVGAGEGALYLDRVTLDAIVGAEGGLRVYFGQRDKTLIQRHREDDPTSIAPFEQTSIGVISNGGL